MSVDGNNSMKSEPYPISNLRHRSDWNLAHDSVDCKYISWNLEEYMPQHLKPSYSKNWFPKNFVMPKSKIEVKFRFQRRKIGAQIGHWLRNIALV